MPPRTSSDLPDSKPRSEKPRDNDAIIEDAEPPAGDDRDLVRGEGGTYELPVKPGDMSKDD